MHLKLIFSVCRLGNAVGESYINVIELCPHFVAKIIFSQYFSWGTIRHIVSDMLGLYSSSITRFTIPGKIKKIFNVVSQLRGRSSLALRTQDVVITEFRPSLWHRNPVFAKVTHAMKVNLCRSSVFLLYTYVPSTPSTPRWKAMPSEVFL